MKKNTGKPSLLLLELVIDLFLFLLCAAVCVALLIHARSLSRESTDLTNAVYLAQSVAEEWRALEAGDRPGPESSETTEQDGYTVKRTEGRGAPGLRACTIAVSRGDKLLYELEEVAPW